MKFSLRRVSLPRRQRSALSDRQVEMLLAGGLINVIKRKLAGVTA